MHSQSTILIVDDTQTNIDVLIELLSDYDLVVATDGISALSILEDESVDLILLDIMMPIIDGFETCQKIKENKKTKDIPIIFLTAKTDDESIQKGFELGGVDYITKPFRPIELRARVKTHLNLKKQEKKIAEQNKYIALGELINNIAHQWRQPLSVISTAASGMLLKYELGMLNNEEMVEMCEDITQSTQYLSSTIDNFKDFTTKSTEKTNFNLKHLIDKNYNMFFESLKNDNIDLVLNIDEDIIINTIENQLLESILHLVSNSKDSILYKNSDNRLIIINAKIKNKNLIIEVLDNGTGIDDKIIDNIFEPYFTTKHQAIGTGLGLYMVHKFTTETSNGEVEASNIDFKYNNKQYKGAKLEIKIPIN